MTQTTIEPGAIRNDSLVTMHFTVRLKDGTVADTSHDENDKPFEFIVGDGSMIEGLELAIIGLKKGDKQTLIIAPEDAFGFSDEENIQWMPKNDFAEEMLKPGVIVEFESPSGDAIPGMIHETVDDKVKVDFNHPLAGHEIEFEVEIINVGS